MARSLTASMIETIQSAARKLTGFERRQFQAEMTIKYGNGNARAVEGTFGWGRQAVSKRLGEFKTQMWCVDNYSARGRKKSEERNSDLAVFIQEITDLPSTLHATLCGCSVGKKEDANT